MLWSVEKKQGKTQNMYGGSMIFSYAKWTSFGLSLIISGYLGFQWRDNTAKLEISKIREEIKTQSLNAAISLSNLNQQNRNKEYEYNKKNQALVERYNARTNHIRSLNNNIDYLHGWLQDSYDELQTYQTRTDKNKCTTDDDNAGSRTPRMVRKGFDILAVCSERYTDLARIADIQQIKIDELRNWADIVVNTANYDNNSPFSGELQAKPDRLAE